MATPPSLSEERLPDEGYIGIVVYLSVLITLGSVVQYATVKILLSQPFRKRKLTPYLLNIVVANTLIILGSFPTTLTSAANRGWVLSVFVCRLSGLITVIGSTAMLSSMTCISHKIYASATTSATTFNQIIIRPHHRKNDVYIIVGIWIFSVVTVLPPFFGWTTMVVEAGNLNCVPDWAPKNIIDTLYMVLLTVLTYIIPVIMAVFFLCKTRTRLVEHTQTMRQLRPNHRLGNLLELFRMEALSITCFTLAWFPYVIYVFMSLAGYKFSVGLTVLPALVAKTSVVLSPFIYAVVTPRFRTSFKAFFSVSSTTNVQGIQQYRESTPFQNQELPPVEQFAPPDAIEMQTYYPPGCHCSKVE